MTSPQNARPGRGLPRLVLSLLVSGGFLYLAFRNVELDELTAALGRLHGGWLAVAVGVSLLIMVLRAVRWQLELRPLARVPVGRLWMVTFVLALVIAVPVLRTRGIYLALATFAFGQVLQSLFLNLEVVGGAAGYPVFAYIGIGGIAAFAFAVFLVTAFLERTRFGLNMVAVHDDEAVSDLFGINVRRYQALAFAIGAAFAGLGGGLYGHHFSYIEPQNYSILFSISVVLFVLLGGTQTVFGPLLGAFFFTLLPEVLRGSEEWRYAIFAVLIIATMILRPQGLVTAGELRAVRRLFGGGGALAGRSHG